MATDVRSFYDSLAGDYHLMFPDGGSFDAVLSSDNSLPHLRTEDDLAAVLARLVPGGVFLASVRDYDTIVRDRVAGVMPTVHGDGGARRIVGQAWTWADEMRTVAGTPPSAPPPTAHGGGPS